MLGSVKILDLTWVLGGPFAGQLLAQLGAEVIKIEPPEGDSSRGIPPNFEGASGFFLSINRGKRSVAIDLKTAEGQQVFHDLVRQADGVIYGFAPDVPKKLGIDFETLRKINPMICVAELIGLHDSPEYARAPAYDIIVQALGGVMSITGEPGGGPARVGYQVGDLGAGLYLALSMVSTILAARDAGEGKKVQISLLDCQLALLTWQAQNYFITGDVPTAVGSRNAVLAPSEAFRCADGRYLAVSPTKVQFLTKFCEILGISEILNDPRFATRETRVKNNAALSAILEPLFLQHTAQEWCDIFLPARVPVAPVLNVAEALSQPVAHLREMVETCVQPQSGHKLRFVGNPFKYSGREPLSYPPALGADTRAVLRDVCGYSAEAIAQLIADKAVYSGEKNDETK